MLVLGHNIKFKMPIKSSQLYRSWILLLYSIFLLDQTAAIFQYCNWNIYTLREVNSATDYTLDVRPSDSLRTFGKYTYLFWLIDLL